MHLVQVQEGIEEFRSRGAEVIAVGQGTGQEASEFCGRFGATFSCVGDVDRSAYAAFGMTKGNWWSVMLKGTLTSPLETARLISTADMEGARLASTDVLQLGGVAILDATGRLRGIHHAVDPKDMPSNAEILRELDRIAA